MVHRISSSRRWDCSSSLISQAAPTQTARQRLLAGRSVSSGALLTSSSTCLGRVDARGEADSQHRHGERECRAKEILTCRHGSLPIWLVWFGKECTAASEVGAGCRYVVARIFRNGKDMLGGSTIAARYNVLRATFESYATQRVHGGMKSTSLCTVPINIALAGSVRFSIHRPIMQRRWIAARSRNGSARRRRCCRCRAVRYLDTCSLIAGCPGMPGRIGNAVRSEVTPTNKSAAVAPL